MLEIVNSSKIKSSSKQYCAIVHKCERVKGNYREVEGKTKASGKEHVTWMSENASESVWVFNCL